MGSYDKYLSNDKAGLDRLSETDLISEKVPKNRVCETPLPRRLSGGDKGSLAPKAHTTVRATPAAGGPVRLIAQIALRRRWRITEAVTDCDHRIIKRLCPSNIELILVQGILLRDSHKGNLIPTVAPNCTYLPGVPPIGLARNPYASSGGMGLATTSSTRTISSYSKTRGTSTNDIARPAPRFSLQ